MNKELADVFSRLCSDKLDPPENADESSMIREAEAEAEPSTSSPNRHQRRQRGAKCSKKTKQSLAIEVENPNNAAQVSGGNQSVIPVMNNMRLLANFQIAEALFKMGYFEPALHFCNEALQIEPHHLVTIFLKGCALYALKRYREACQVLQTALHLYPARTEIEEALLLSKSAYARIQCREYDISQYLIGAQEPPEVEDFIGYVEIKRTRGRRGRGLFATKDVVVGEVLLVSNAAVIVTRRAVRATQNDLSHEIKASLHEDLVAAVFDAARESQKLRQQLYELDDGSLQVRSSLPAMDLFHASRQETTEALPELNLQRIRDIVSRNSFGRLIKKFPEERPQDGEPFSFSGLWPLLSFINHSCLPNANRVYVGRTVFLHAAKPIKKREEITISYFDALLPQPQREAICGVWGFNCNCRRCGVEKSLSNDLESLNALFEATVNAGQDLTTELSKSAEFAQVFEKLEQILAKYPERMNEEKKNWVRASYVSACWDGTPAKLFPWSRVDEIVKAIVSTVPGDFRNLTIVGLHMEAFKDQARDILVRLLGRPSQRVIDTLLSLPAQNTQ